MAPPELPRDAPGLDILHPVEIGLFPALRYDLDIAVANRLDRRLGEGFGIDIPLIGQPWLDDHAAAVAEWRRNGARFGVMFDLFAVLVL